MNSAPIGEPTWRTAVPIVAHFGENAATIRSSRVRSSGVSLAERVEFK
jgi:hypothetical protein